MEPGSQVSVPMSSGSVTTWTITYHDTVWNVGANYTAEQGVIGFESAQGDRFIVKPERRHYPVRVMNMSEPAIYSKWHGDYYVTLGPKVDSRSYAVKNTIQSLHQLDLVGCDYRHARGDDSFIQSCSKSVKESHSWHCFAIVRFWCLCLP
ncbi:cytochrome c-type biogenesis CcmF C-terminal domain-containing protein [Vibrio sinaloensis]|nr:cytochrome c-type biogenesis CcmF C-terminal domain-containing protein [Vibrio sinaloensis]